MKSQIIDKEPLFNISDTASWVAAFRADESERRDAVFIDPFARKLSGEHGGKLTNENEFGGKDRWSFIARTYLLDQLILQHVAEGFTMIINLAAGLDSRPYRMNLPGNLKWVEVDFPEMIQYKQSILAKECPACQLESISMDLSNRNRRIQLFKRLGAESEKVLVIAEGLMVYLTQQEAGELAQDLSAQSSFRHWAFDLVSPAVLRRIQKGRGIGLKEANINFKFAPEKGEAFFAPYGWNWLYSYSKLKTAARLKRLPNLLMRLYAALPEARGPERKFPWAGLCLFNNNINKI